MGHRRMAAMMRVVLSALLGLALSAAASALDPGEMFDDPGKEERAREIGRSLRCLVCQNQSIFDSNAGLAKDLRVLVRQRMEAGDSDGEVIDYIASRYGDYVRLNPPVKATTSVLWIAPAAAVLIGVAAFFAYHRSRSNRVGRTKLDPAARSEARRVLEGGEP